MMLVIIAGHIDLSVGSRRGVHRRRRGGPDDASTTWRGPLALVLCLVVGAAVGAGQGFWIAYLGIPSFIVTLAGMLIFRGLTLVLLKGATLGPAGRLQKMGNGFLPEVGPDTNYPTSPCCWASRCWPSWSPRRSASGPRRSTTTSTSRRSGYSTPSWSRWSWSS